MRISLGGEVFEELLRGLACFGFDAEYRLSADAGGVGGLQRFFTGDGPHVAVGAVRFGVEPVFGPGDLAAGRFENLRDELDGGSVSGLGGDRR